MSKEKHQQQKLVIIFGDLQDVKQSIFETLTKQQNNYGSMLKQLEPQKIITNENDKQLLIIPDTENATQDELVTFWEIIDDLIKTYNYSIHQLIFCIQNNKEKMEQFSRNLKTLSICCESENLFRVTLITKQLLANEQNQTYSFIEKLSQTFKIEKQYSENISKPFHLDWEKLKNAKHLELTKFIKLPNYLVQVKQKIYSLLNELIKERLNYEQQTFDIISFFKLIDDEKKFQQQMIKSELLLNRDISEFLLYSELLSFKTTIKKKLEQNTNFFSKIFPSQIASCTWCCKCNTFMKEKQNFLSKFTFTNPFKYTIFNQSSWCKLCKQQGATRLEWKQFESFLIYAITSIFMKNYILCLQIEDQKNKISIKNEQMINSPVSVSSLSENILNQEKIEKLDVSVQSLANQQEMKQQFEIKQTRPQHEKVNQNQGQNEEEGKKKLNESAFQEGDQKKSQQEQQLIIPNCEKYGHQVNQIDQHQQYEIVDNSSKTQKSEIYRQPTIVRSISALFLSQERLGKTEVFNIISGKPLSSKTNPDKFYKYDLSTQIRLIDSPCFDFGEDQSTVTSLFKDFLSKIEIHYIFLFVDYQRKDLMKTRLSKMITKLINVDRKKMAIVITNWDKCQDQDEKIQIYEMGKPKNIETTITIRSNESKESILEKFRYYLDKTDGECLSFQDTAFAKETEEEKKEAKQFEDQLQKFSNKIQEDQLFQLKQQLEQQKKHKQYLEEEIVELENKLYQKKQQLYEQRYRIRNTEDNLKKYDVKKSGIFGWW